MALFTTGATVFLAEAWEGLRAGAREGADARVVGFVAGRATLATAAFAFVRGTAGFAIRAVATAGLPTERFVGGCFPAGCFAAKRSTVECFVVGGFVAGRFGGDALFAFARMTFLAIATRVCGRAFAIVPTARPDAERVGLLLGLEAMGRFSARLKRGGRTGDKGTSGVSVRRRVP